MGPASDLGAGLRGTNARVRIQSADWLRGVRDRGLDETGLGDEMGRGQEYSWRLGMKYRRRTDWMCVTDCVGDDYKARIKLEQKANYAAAGLRQGENCSYDNVGSCGREGKAERLCKRYFYHP